MAIVAALPLGMIQEGSLLLLLFQGSHMLEEYFTAKARGSLNRLFASIPSKALSIELDASGSPVMTSATFKLARDLKPGQHVLVKPGEQVWEV